MTVQEFIKLYNSGHRYFGDMDFRGADFRGVNFSTHLITQKHPVRVSFENSNFEDANLEGVNLSACIFKGANLRGANLTKTKLEYTLFDGAKGLDSVIGMRYFPCEGASRRTTNLGVFVVLDNNKKAYAVSCGCFWGSPYTFLMSCEENNPKYLEYPDLVKLLKGGVG